MQLLEHFKELSLHPKNAKELKGLILQLAIQGKLTAKWREENPDLISGENSAESLLKKIKAEKALLIKEKKIRKSSSNEPIKSDSLPFYIPEEWEWVRLSDIGFIFNGNSINKSEKEEKYSGLDYGLPYIATKDVGYVFDELDYKNGIRIPIEADKFKVAKPGTVLVCSEGGSAGKKMGITNHSICFGNKLYAIQQFSGIEGRYILNFCGSNSFFNSFQKRMTGIIGGISISKFNDIEFPLPSALEQMEILKVVDQLLVEVEQLEQLTEQRIQLKEHFATSALKKLTEEDTQAAWSYLKPHFKAFFNEETNVQQLRESILQLAVQGKLTTKWRNEHPELISGENSAHSLLQKIKAEKAQLIKEKKIKKEKPLPAITEEEIPFAIPDGWVWCRLEDLMSITGGVAKGKKNRGELINTPYLRVANVQRGFLDLNIIKDIAVTQVDFEKYQLLHNDLLMIEGGDPDKLGRCAIWSNEIKDCIYQNHVFRVRPYLPELINNYYMMQFINSRITRNYYESCAKRTTNLASINKTQMRSTPVVFPCIEEQKAIVEKVNSLMAFCDQLDQEITKSKVLKERWMGVVLREEV